MCRTMTTIGGGENREEQQIQTLHIANKKDKQDNVTKGLRNQSQRRVCVAS